MTEPSFGKFMAAKMNRLNPAKVSSAVGISWYTRETYPLCLAIFEDAADLPRTFDAWLQKAEETEKELRQEGMRVLRVEIDPSTFPAWCAATGHRHIDKEARGHFGNLMVLEVLKNEDST